MTVSTQVSRNEYTGNGATTQYDFTFRILDKSHLLVQTLDTSESIVTLTLGTDYTVTGVNRYNGGKVVLTSALPAGYKISIERSTPVTQEASIRNQGGFFPEIHEDALDKLTMLVQQAYGWWSGLSLRKPSWLANYYDALNNRIRNLRDPSQAQDAATKGYADNLYQGAISHSDNNFKRTLRVPESEVGMLPGISGRRKKILAFNDTGNPIAVLPESGSAADVMIDLASSDGFKYIGQVRSAAELSLLPGSDGDRVLLYSYNAITAVEMPVGGGTFYYDSSLSAVNNGVTIFNGWCRVIENNKLTDFHAGCQRGDASDVGHKLANLFSVVTDG
ncbi:phage tail fiber domain-containing protein, partial [Raoultella ornithinolytica]